MGLSDFSARDAARYLLRGMAVTLALVGAKLLLEATPVGHWAEHQTRSFLLGLLPSFREEGADAIVVDISHFAGGEVDPATGRLRVTSREKLKELLVVLRHLAPAAIGIDSDFSTQGGDWLSPGDPRFFDYCLELNKSVPIRLGVWRSIVDPSGHWLELPVYSRLAAALFVTDSRSGRLPLWVSAGSSTTRLPTLGAALAAAVSTSPWDPYSIASSGGVLRRLVFEDTAERELALKPSSIVVRTQEAPVNYSVMRQLGREYIPRAEPSDLAKYASRIQGRFVILGAAERSDDLFALPGESQSRPGVFLHAAQAHTLSSEPVYEFSHAFRIAADFVISFVLLMCVVVWRWRASRGQMAHRVSEFRVVAIGCAVVAALGIGLIVAFRIFWLDFVLVAIFLLLHKPTEHALLESHDHAAGARHASE